jgi:hypothetical protein
MTKRNGPKKTEKFRGEHLMLDEVRKGRKLLVFGSSPGLEG